MTATAPELDVAHLYIPDGARGNYGDEVADVADMIGRPLDPSQRLAVDALTSYGAGGRWLALEGLIKEPRQNGKTGGIITPIVLADLFLWPADRIAWSAHLFKTCREAFADHKLLIDGVPEFRRRVKKITEANGEESIELVTGARLDYLARSKGGGRGLGGKRTVIDEALFFTGEQAGALLPILAAREDPQITYGSSGCKVESSALRALTRRGRGGGDPSIILVEFKAPGGWDTPGCDLGTNCTHVIGSRGCALDDPARWLAANPAMRFNRITIEFMLAMRRTLTPLEFGREFLGWDEDGPEDGVRHPITVAGWAETEGPPAAAMDRPRFFVTVGVQGDACIAVAYGGDRPHVELADHRTGAAWLPERLRELDERWPGALFGAGAAGPVKGMAEAGLPVAVEFVTAVDMAQACRHHEALHRERRYTHARDGQLDASLAGAVAKPVGDGLWKWDWKTSTHLAPIAAITGALWLHETHRDYDPLDSVI